MSIDVIVSSCLNVLTAVKECRRIAISGADLVGQRLLFGKTTRIGKGVTFQPVKSVGCSLRVTMLADVFGTEQKDQRGRLYTMVITWFTTLAIHTRVATATSRSIV